MKLTRWIILSIAGLTPVLWSASAATTNRIFRTAGLFYAFTQGDDAAVILGGHNFVNLAMGRPATSTAATNQVLAITLPCDFGSADLVVYDQATTSIVTNLASASSIDTLVQIVTNRDNQVRFLAQFQVNPNGSATNGLLGGYLTVAGRIHANRTNGCPETVPVSLDHDSHDVKFGDKDVPRAVDPDNEKLNKRAGLAHLTGVIDAIQAGITNTLLIPAGQLSIRGEQP